MVIRGCCGKKLFDLLCKVDGAFSAFYDLVHHIRDVEFLLGLYLQPKACC